MYIINNFKLKASFAYSAHLFDIFVLFSVSHIAFIATIFSFDSNFCVEFNVKNHFAE